MPFINNCNNALFNQQYIRMPAYFLIHSPLLQNTYIQAHLRTENSIWFILYLLNFEWSWDPFNMIISYFYFYELILIIY